MSSIENAVKKCIEFFSGQFAHRKRKVNFMCKLTIEAKHVNNIIVALKHIELMWHFFINYYHHR